MKAGWYPAGLTGDRLGKITISWQDLTGIPFTEPFFEDTLRLARAAAHGRLHTAGAPCLDGVETLPPTGFLFHTSRSGSTLVTQLLSCLGGCIALSEPPVVDDVLQSPLAGPEKSTLLRHLVQALAQRRAIADSTFFLKFDCWHLASLPLIRQAFPDVPCYFIHRHPVEILWSHHRQRGSQMVPGLRPLGELKVNLDNVHPADFDAHTARVLAALFAEADRHIKAGELIPVSHTELRKDPLSVIQRLGVRPDPAEQAAIATRGQYHSKRKGETYQPDTERDIPPAIRRKLESLASPDLLAAFAAWEHL